MILFLLVAGRHSAPRCCERREKEEGAAKRQRPSCATCSGAYVDAPGQDAMLALRSGARKSGAEEKDSFLLVGDLDLAAGFLDEAVDQPGGRRARGDRLLARLAGQSELELGVDDDSRPLGAHRD